MAIYIGSTLVQSIELGEAGYGLPGVVKIYLGSTLVWQSA
jgi:hypothetical protein